MAQSDFRMISGGIVFPFYGVSGSARLHSDLTSSYLSGGFYYRSFERNVTGSGGNGNTALAAFIPLTSSLTSSTGYSYGKSYSLRALVRIITPPETVGYASTNDKSKTGVSLIFKGEQTLSVVTDLSENSVAYNSGSSDLMTSSYYAKGSGYRLSFMRQATQGLSADGEATQVTTLVLRCSSQRSLSGRASPTPSEALYKTIIASGSSTNYNSWHKIRMDVIPVTGSHDIIKVYTGSLTSDTWSLLHTQNVYSANSGSYVPWNFGSNPNQFGYMGFIVSSDTCAPSQTNVATLYAAIDDFQVFTEDI